jgi:hypothetical protein
LEGGYKLLLPTTFCVADFVAPRTDSDQTPKRLDFSERRGRMKTLGCFQGTTFKYIDPAAAGPQLRHCL